MDDIRAQIRAAALNRHPEWHSSVGFKWERFVDSILDAAEDGDSDDGERYVLDGFYSERGSKRHRRIGGGKRYAHAGFFRAEHRNGRYRTHVKSPYAHAMHKSTCIGHEVRAGVSACSLGVQYGHQLEVSMTGPYAGAEAHAKYTGVGGGLYAGLGKVFARAGPITVSAGYDIDTEARVGLDGVKLKVFGTGINIGSNGIEANVLGMGIGLNAPVLEPITL
ncbi:uncharacterized protein LOC128557953 [Mercenaria mercenaria]|uniref:uncharacterized protein LOC128557953 n=1 Tax=Mercenaria mercenaria TaxID=6596 RepID=UPI00234F5AEE|nr:uncharacterized protein LOC128557953 [Mercenaria mercenaria]